MNKYPALAIIFLSASVVILTVGATFQNAKIDSLSHQVDFLNVQFNRIEQFPTETFPSFLSQTPNNKYTIAYIKDNCVIQLGLRQGVGGIWFEDGHADCPTSESTQMSNYQTLINQAIAEHKATCLAFSPNLNGTTTFSYSTEPLCGDPWHSIVVVSKP